MDVRTGQPFAGRELERLKLFLTDCGLDYDPGVDFTVILEDDDGIAATASLDGSTVKCIAVSPLHRGEDLSAKLMTAILSEAFERGSRRLLLYTKPANAPMFTPLGFSTVVRTRGCLLMENVRDGVGEYLRGLERFDERVTDIGCIVANCDPITNGHRYLIESAAKRCEALYVFILSEDRSRFPAADRLELARRVCAPLKNVLVQGAGRYMISSATFPSYFIRDKVSVDRIYCDVDIALFAGKIAPALGIRRRFVGTEPYCPVTRFYNEALRAGLPPHGIELIEIDRLEKGGEAVSASRVRALHAAGDIDALRPLVPLETLDYLIAHPKGE